MIFELNSAEIMNFTVQNRTLIEENDFVLWRKKHGFISTAVRLKATKEQETVGGC